jgi:DNA-binding MarR family transcriptional regulator
MTLRPDQGIVLLRTTLKCHRIAKELAAEVNLSVNEMHCLMQLHFEKPDCVRKLTEVLGLRGTSISKLLRSLEERKFIERSLDTIDRRVERVVLTAEGFHVAEQVLALSEDFVENIIIDLPLERQHPFLECLQMISENTEPVRTKEAFTLQFPDDN